MRYTGNVEVYFWVGPDGIPSHVSIVAPVGLGLDEKAVGAVTQYRFAPATRDGQPVTVDLYVDVNFQIL
jgi:protein TonB